MDEDEDVHVWLVEDQLLLGGSCWLFLKMKVADQSRCHAC